MCKLDFRITKMVHPTKVNAENILTLKQNQTLYNWRPKGFLHLRNIELTNPTLDWDGIKVLLLRLNFDWRGNWYGKLRPLQQDLLQRSIAAVDNAAVDDSFLFYCGALLLRQPQQKRNESNLHSNLPNSSPMYSNFFQLTRCAALRHSSSTAAFLVRRSSRRLFYCGIPLLLQHFY